MRRSIWCRVVDHFGDAGVCWRIARDLAQQLNQSAAPLSPVGARPKALQSALLPANVPTQQVTLVIDRVDILNRLVPSLDPQAGYCDGVHIVQWEDAQETADIVICAFGCRLPDSMLQTMQQQRPAPVWINLEHLSPQTWVEGCHLLPSPHQTTGLVEYFYFPGFSQRTGGLPREPGLLEKRDRFLADPTARADVLTRVGVPPALHGLPALMVFCYPDAPLEALLRAIHREPPTLILLCGDTRAIAEPGHDNATVFRMPFIAQAEFDALLWCCAAAFVRGEDSLVRAHWAGIPFIWQPYRQADHAHRDKLQAWLDLAWGPKPQDTLNAAAGAALHRALSHAWDQADASALEATWPQWWAHRAQLRQSALEYAAELATHPSLLEGLQSFVRDQLESRVVEGSNPA